MNKLFLSLLVVLLLASCSNSENSSGNWTAVKQHQLDTVYGLTDCVYTKVVTPFNTPTLHVIRCPGSDTTTKWSVQTNKNRNSHTATTIDTDVERAKEALARAEALKRISPEDRKLLGFD